ncbi:hypothetical protein N3114_12630 (plasmid) [Aliarcobacter butzleri]|uniref:hypothetical protein n=1 Tax=Aliarcobacter butzleri TaxID=28197 RepID=UPI0021B2C967|nr:hypothetical protein [Aliarcobacter butzleri]UXC30735.1 hypothetical protein N3114_12630 [Aliarcobacter butzleri]
MKKAYPCSINNTTYKINAFLVEALSLKVINKFFNQASSKEKAEVKKYIRNLTLDIEKLNTYIIETIIIKDLVDIRFKKELEKLNT